jgi:hypothetical protein
LHNVLTTCEFPQNSADAKNRGTQDHPQRGREEQVTQSAVGAGKSVNLQGIAKALVATGHTRE